MVCEFSAVFCNSTVIEIYGDKIQVPQRFRGCQMLEYQKYHQASETEYEEKTALIEALKKSMGNRSQAARLLGISRGTVCNEVI
jgi:transcriptional regulator of acetoin/glycerol metabolism